VAGSSLVWRPESVGSPAPRMASRSAHWPSPAATPRRAHSLARACSTMKAWTATGARHEDTPAAGLDPALQLGLGDQTGALHTPWRSRKGQTAVAIGAPEALIGWAQGDSRLGRQGGNQRFRRCRRSRRAPGTWQGSAGGSPQTDERSTSSRAARRPGACSLKPCAQPGWTAASGVARQRLSLATWRACSSTSPIIG